MIQNLTSLELQVGERVYKFLCAVDAPIGEVHDVLTKMKSFVIQKINEAEAVQSSSATQESGENG